jgi:hypothetical protein
VLLAVIRATEVIFITAKDFRTYKRIILRQDKRLRDHAPTLPDQAGTCGASAARCAWDDAVRLS